MTTPPKSGKLAADVKTRRIYWDWNNRIPRRELVIVEGESGVAKSTLIADISARITRGGVELPDDPHNRAPGWFVTLSAEDDGAAIVKPRLVAAGADLARCPILYATGDTLRVDGEDVHEMRLPDDVDQVADWLRWIREQDPLGPCSWRLTHWSPSSTTRSTPTATIPRAEPCGPWPGWRSSMTPRS